MGKRVSNRITVSNGIYLEFKLQAICQQTGKPQTSTKIFTSFSSYSHVHHSFQSLKLILFRRWDILPTHLHQVIRVCFQFFILFIADVHCSLPPRTCQSLFIVIILV